MRITQKQRLYGLFNFSKERVFISWYIFKEHGISPQRLFDHWNQVRYEVGTDQEYLSLDPYSFCLMEAE
jgi:amylosucrase